MKQHCRLIVRQCQGLQGSVAITGAKNAALKMLAATLLTEQPCTLDNLPHLQDIIIMCDLLADLGCDLTLLDNNQLQITASSLQDLTVPYELVKQMRASIVVLGPLLAAHGQANVALPGGCAIGSRPVDMHLDGLRKMGAKIELSGGFIKASVDGKLKGADIHMHTVTVTGTENLIMAATLAEGETHLYNAACEPEIVDLAEMLTKMGANISGAGTPHVTIRGVDKLSGCEHRVVADRIEAGTYLIAAAMTGGCVSVGPVSLDIVGNISQLLERAGVRMSQEGDYVTADMRGMLPQSVSATTAPFPGFATDMQAQLMAMNTVAHGRATITETIFENRFMHVPELQRMGADIHVQGKIATITGVDHLNGVPVMAKDLRAAASLILAGLVAKGETVVEGVHHLDRGYEYLEEKFCQLGADIQRVVC